MRPAIRSAHNDLHHRQHPRSRRRDKTSAAGSLVLDGPRCCTLEVRVGQAGFFCSSGWCSHKSYFFSKSTSSKNRLLFSLSSPSSFPTRSPHNYTHAITLARTRGSHPLTLVRSYRNIFSTGRKNLWYTCGLSVGVLFLCKYHNFPWGVFRARRHLPTSRDTSRPNFAAAARTPNFAAAARTPSQPHTVCPADGQVRKRAD